MPTVLTAPLDRAMRYAALVFAVITAVSALTLLVALVLEWVAPAQVTWVVWLRAGCYALGGLWLLTLVRRVRDAAHRPSYTRIRVVAVLAPLGILALVLSPDSGYPAWMKVGQGALGLLLVPLALMVVRPSLRRELDRSGTTGS